MGRVHVFTDNAEVKNDYNSLYFRRDSVGKIKIYTSNIFFDSELVITYRGDGAMIIRKAGIDDIGTRRPYKNENKNRTQFTLLIICDFPPGFYIPDIDESNEDQLIIFPPEKK